MRQRRFGTMNPPRIRVYMAGPMYSSGRLMDNIRHAAEVGRRLMDKGFAPYWPQACAFIDMVSPATEAEWLELDKEWLMQCHVLLRLPGASRGADLEVTWCRELGIPVFYNESDLEAWARIEGVLG